MFDYTDPVGTGRLAQESALDEYRLSLHQLYVESARLPNSAFTLLEAFADLEPQHAQVTWKAFPRTANASNETIDQDRLRWQDEYVEWRTARSTNGSLTGVTFTTEFPEYYEALAAVDVDALRRGIRDVIPAADPSDEDLFGPNFDPENALPLARARMFRSHRPRNPWNNGSRGILCLTQQFNTLRALLNLVANCAIPQPDLDPADVCGQVGGACGPGRESDPVVCATAQRTARAGRALSLADPAGIQILRLEGIWKVNGRQIDINDPDQNQGAWRILRNGRRAELDMARGVTLEDDTITTGAQVATKLIVGSTVVTAPEDALPTWARTGHESSRAIV